jgi:uncharacterized phiE125 gp8 family phage protein
MAGLDPAISSQADARVKPAHDANNNRHGRARPGHLFSGEPMHLTLTTPPALEPLTLAEAKLHLRLDDGADDDALASLIAAARIHIERSHGLILIAQAWRLYLDDWPRAPDIALPLWPVSAVAAVKLLGEEGEAFLIDEAHYVTETGERPARIIRRTDRQWPKPAKAHSGIAVEFTAGFGETPADVPAPIREALKLWLGFLYEHGGGEAPAAGPASATMLLSPYREVRL